MIWFFSQHVHPLFGGSQGGVGLVTRERPTWWGIEYTCCHRTNVLSCKIVTKINQTPIVGAYLPPLTLEDLPDLEDFMQRFRGPILFGDWKVDLKKIRSLWSQRMSEILAEYGLVDLVRNFQQRCRFRDLKTAGFVTWRLGHKSDREPSFGWDAIAFLGWTGAASIW